MWSYNRDKYRRREDAICATDPEALKNPHVQHALFQIAVMEAFLDDFMESREVD